MHEVMTAPLGALPLSGRSRKRRLTAAEKLAARAQAAADVRAYDTNPDVIAYRVERMRARVDRLMWAGIVAGLAFTAANVQQFAAAGAEPWSIPWCIAWLLDPTVSLILLGTLLGEQVIARHQIAAGPWIRRTKWTALALTYLMNTWSSWAALDPAAILLNSVPPAIVFAAAEAITTLKHQITEAVHRAYEQAAVRADAVPLPAAPARPGKVIRFQPRPRTEPVRDVRHRRVFTFARAASAREQARTKPVRQPVRQPAEREAFVAELREEILAAAERGDTWGPNYEDLMARSGRSRSWTEKRVREARASLFRTDARTGVSRTEVAA